MYRSMLMGFSHPYHAHLLSMVCSKSALLIKLKFCLFLLWQKDGLKDTWNMSCWDKLKIIEKIWAKGIFITYIGG